MTIANFYTGLCHKRTTSDVTKLSKNSTTIVLLKHEVVVVGGSGTATDPWTINE